MSNIFEVDDIVIVDKSKLNFISNKIYFIKFGGNFLLRKLSRIPDLNGIRVSPTNLNKSNEYQSIDVKSISDIQIIGAPVLRLNFIKGL